MTPERYARVCELFEAAAPLPAPERAAFLDRACADDPDLSAEVERMLAMDDRGPGESFLAGCCPLNLKAIVPTDGTGRPRFGDVTAPVPPALTPHHSNGSPGGARPVSDDPPPAMLLGRYQIRGRLGAGGFGVVYKGYDEVLRRPVAIKVPYRDRVASAADAEAYLTEARVLARLDHPGILPVYDVGRTDDGLCYLVSKLVEGCDLATRLRQGPVSVAEAAEIVTRVALALHHAHEHGLVHRDVKPANILLEQRNENQGVYTPRSPPTPLVADFGLALHEEDVGQGPALAGTPSYMSPEQACGEGHRVDGRSDVFSLGVVFYELLTGRVPFPAQDVLDRLAQINAADPPPPRQLDPTIPRELERVCLKCLARRAADRYATALNLAEDLRHWLATQATPQPPVPPALPLGRGDPDPTPRGFGVSIRPAAPVVPKGLRSFDPPDADFFLELLPGPRDRDGLPESVRFWKSRVEEADPDRTFTVGLLYGPSGCGKSSLVKAGILPRLSDHVRGVYVEAAPDGTEARLLRALRTHCPGLPEAGLAETLARLRRGRALPAGGKVLLVLDQFEQWLHAGRAEAGAELVQALRQCDGRHVQCLLLVRDDFWLAASRFMRDLEVHLVEGHNVALVDLFDPAHARRVLAALGRAFGRLPEDRAALTPEHERFLDQAVAGLAEDGKVVCVRLALFAEMVKGRPWVPATLRAVGGAAGIGVTFLEESFSARTANPEHRLHEKAARAVLQALLPEPGTDLKGHTRSRDELLAASGYGHRPEEFEALVRILDNELRLVSPAEVAAYQLTHDYLVPSVREWLTRKQRETRRGRAELSLAERAAAWTVRPEARQLPTWGEWLRIRLYTRRRGWGPGPARMMRAATRRHVSRGGLMAACLLALALAGAIVWKRVEAGLSERHAGTLVARLLEARTEDVPRVVADLASYRAWAEPRLRAVVDDPGRPRKERLHASLALLPHDRAQANALRDHLLAAEPAELPVVRDALAPFRDRFGPALWQVLRSPGADRGRRVRAACALAAFDPDPGRWEAVKEDVVGYLVSDDRLAVAHWVAALRPVSPILIGPLRTVFAERREEEAGQVAADALAEYVGDRPEALVRLVRVAAPRQLPPLARKLAAHGDTAVGLLNAILAERVAPRLTAQPPDQPYPLPPDQDDFLDDLAWLHARAAVALVLIGRAGAVWPLLAHSPDPRLRSYLVHQFAAAGVDPRVLVRRLEVEADVSARRALLLALGEYPGEALGLDERGRLVTGLVNAYGSDPDPGIHSSVAWLLRRWGHGGPLRPMDRRLASRDPVAERGWYVNGQGLTMAVIPGPVEGLQGSPYHEAYRVDTETPVRRVRIGRSFAIGTCEVTNEQFRRLVPDHEVHGGRFGPEPTCPATFVTWYLAARYCRWLSEREGIPEDQMCYPPLDQIKPGMKPYPDYLTRTGYRLPTEAEWEYACRAGAITPRFYGNDPALLSKYAWHLETSNNRSRPVGRLKPNDLGLFDAHGNAYEWCQDAYAAYPARVPDFRAEDFPPAGPVADDVPRVQRDGPFSTAAVNVRSAVRRAVLPGVAYPDVGFRVARTVHTPGLSARLEGQGHRALADFSVEGTGPFVVHCLQGDLDIQPRRAVAPATVRVAGQAPADRPVAFAVERAGAHEAVTVFDAEPPGQWLARAGWVNSIGMHLALIPPGEFVMGAGPEEVADALGRKRPDDAYGRMIIASEGPPHRVRITRPFYLGTHEVTAGQFRRFIHATGYRTEAERDRRPVEGIVEGHWRQMPADTTWRRLAAESSYRHPVVWVTHADAVAFCRWLSAREGATYRLPTEAEWEYACRAGTTTCWPCGTQSGDLPWLEWFGDNAGGEAQPTARLRPNAWGLWDMLGNVNEWCSDLFDAEYYRTGPAVDPSGPTTTKVGRVLRGGTFLDVPAGCRPAHRWADADTHRSNATGFRVVREAAGVAPPPFALRPVGRSVGAAAEYRLFGRADCPGGARGTPFVIKDVTGGVHVSPRAGKTPAVVHVISDDRAPRPFSLVAERADTHEAVRVAGVLFAPEWDITYYPWKAPDPTRPAPPTPAQWRQALAAPPLARRRADAIDFAWGDHPPAARVPADFFAVVATAAADLPAGLYEVAAHADDGVRVFIDGHNVLDNWGPPALKFDQARVRLAAGPHEFRVEYYEFSNVARLKVSLACLEPAPPGTATDYGLRADSPKR